MAISADTIASRCDALSAEDSAQVDHYEALIDSHLEVNYAPGKAVQWGWNVKLSTAQVRELSRRYRAAGWEVEAHNKGHLILILSASDDSPTDAPTVEANGTQ